MVEKQIDIIIKKYIEKLMYENIPINKVILYGSFAGGCADKDSDIDLAVISPVLGYDRFDEALMLKRLARGIDLNISPRPYSVKQYWSAGQGDFLFDEIIQKGKTVYEE